MSTHPILKIIGQKCLRLFMSVISQEKIISQKSMFP